MKSPTSSPCVCTPPDALGTSTGDSISTLPNTICADTPRPSETGNMSTSVDSAGNATQRNDSLVDHLLTLSNMTASILSQNEKLSPSQAAALERSASAMLYSTHAISTTATACYGSLERSVNLLLPDSNYILIFSRPYLLTHLLSAATVRTTR